jgi:hypothetical protein
MTRHCHRSTENRADDPRAVLYEGPRVVPARNLLSPTLW